MTYRKKTKPSIRLSLLSIVLPACFAFLTACGNSSKKSSSPSPQKTSVATTPVPEKEYLDVKLKSFSGEKLFDKDLVTKFYTSHNYKPVWKNDRKEKLYKLLKNADEQGLLFEDYHGNSIQKLIEAKRLSLKQKNRLEILLTDALFKYADNLYYGKLNPKKMYEVWGVNRKKIDWLDYFQKALKENKLKSSLLSLSPQNRFYQGLKKSLSEYKNFKNKRDVPQIPKGEVIRPNDRDSRIPLISKRLKQKGFLKTKYVADSNTYDQKLQSAIKRFQKSKGLSTDGIIGEGTINALNIGPEQKYNKILANMERWRWYPRNLGEHYFLINIANYKLTVVKDGKIIQAHNVITGDPRHHTPVFSDRISYIVLNPEWHIPTSIAKKEIIPRAAADSNYLESRNIYAVDSNGNRVNSDSINWENGEAYRYRYVQSSGPWNSLGKIKIIYPNPYAIYLHDTPARGLFNLSKRAESHGCVRVEGVLDLTAYILKDQKEWSLENIQKVIDSTNTVQINVTQPIQVHHFYWTAWREGDKTVFINDIYNLDKEIYTDLKK